MNILQNQFSPLPQDFFVKISVLKSLMYRGVVWGLYNDNGWAMSSDQEHHIFPFWLSPSLAQKHAEQHWPNYTPRQISSDDFQKSLLPTLNRLKVLPTLYNTNEQKFKFTAQLMQYFFFKKNERKNQKSRLKDL